MSRRGDRTWRVVRGALRSAVHDHGPITAENMDSAAKRIVSQLRQTAGVLDCDGDDVAATKIDHLQKQLQKLRHGHAIMLSQFDRCRAERDALRAGLPYDPLDGVVLKAGQRIWEGEAVVTISGGGEHGD